MKRLDRTQLDRESIRRLVDDFYSSVADDDLLGPVFEAHVDGRWPAHKSKMVDFWSAALLGEPGYRGNPRVVHARIDGIGPVHFRRWLVLFAEIVAASFEPDVAEAIQRRAEAMAGGLLSACGYGRDQLQPHDAPSLYPSKALR